MTMRILVLISAGLVALVAAPSSPATLSAVEDAAGDEPPQPESARSVATAAATITPGRKIDRLVTSLFQSWKLGGPRPSIWIPC